MGQPPPGPAPPWSGDGQPAIPGFEFDDRALRAGLLGSDPFHPPAPPPGPHGDPRESRPHLADLYQPDPSNADQYVATHRQAPGKTPRQAPSQTHRQAPSQTHRQAPSQTHRQAPGQAHRQALGRAADRRRGGEGGPGRSDPRTAGTEWTKLVRSVLPQPPKRNWFKEFLAALEFRGWVTRVAIPILAMIVFGVAVVVVLGANSGNVGPAPSATSLGFPPASLAGDEFTAAASGRGISQTLGQVASDGAEIVAVGSQTGARIARAQFFFSPNDGRSWTMGSVRTPTGAEPPPGHAAQFVAGGQGEWVAAGPGSIWTSPDGRTWTLAPSAAMPLAPGDRISTLSRTAAGFIAVGTNVPDGDQAKSSPVIFLSANGISWQRLDASQLRLPAGTGRVLDLRYAAAEGKLILIAGDVTTTSIVTTTTTKVVGKSKRVVTSKRAVTTVTSGAWLSGDGGSAWGTAAAPGAAPAGHGAQPRITGVAAVNGGFVLFRPAAGAQTAGAQTERAKTAGAKQALDVYRSANGTAWTFEATLSTPAGLVAGPAAGGPAGAVVAGLAGRTLIAFVSADGVTWQQSQAFGSAAAEAVSGVAKAGDDAVITGTTAGPQSRQPAITMVAAGDPAVQVDVTKIPGAFDPQLAVNALAAGHGTQVAVGSANGYPAAWASADGDSSWTRGAGATEAVLERPGAQQLTSVTYGSAGWLAVGGVTAGAVQHPVVVSSAGGTSWQAADGEAVFGGPGLFTEQAAAGPGGYVIVGYQDVKRAGTGQATEIAAAWWSAGLTGWQRAAAPAAAASTAAASTAAGATAAGGSESGTGQQMLAVTASSGGFVAVGSTGTQASAWISPDGRTWSQAALPVPIGSTRAVLQHVASSGRTVVAVGTALTASGQQLPFAASSPDGGRTWTEAALPVPADLTSVTALAAAEGPGGGFTATGTFGTTPGHQDVVVWTSANGSSWKAATPAGQGMTGPGIQAITGLSVSGSTLTGVGFTASPSGEQPVFWQSPLR